MKKLMATIAMALSSVLATADHHIPNAVDADPEHYTVEFENDVVRVVRIRYEAGDTSPMHSHYAGCVVSVKQGDIRMEMPDGSSGPAPVTAVGEVACNDAGAHRPTNAGDTVTEAVMVELVGRTTFE